MQIKIVSIGNRMPKWVDQGFHEYARRMPRICEVELLEIAAKKRFKNADTDRIMLQEAEAMRAAISPSALTVALDRRGKPLDTLSLAKHMQNWIDDSQDVAILIGGPEGIDRQYLQGIDLNWSLSALTFAHPIVRVILAEQLYRAWSINANLPYHRGG
ncbi:MAG: 23S rRNA (pseudouridine(1915)-N(3))-methyltransferase RlmH [Gammaproteobacteria bacterium]|nr:23S rRNA (pseudouridine(1915)-N(3))-methyltransferase RlmH [Gammaproteobacteria bacterium]